MKQILNNIFKGTLSLLSVTVVSCMDLKEVPEGKIAPSNFYKTVEQCQSALVGSMGGLLNTWGGYNGSPGWPNGQQPSSLNFAVTSNNDFWSMHFTSISYINPVINAIKAGNLNSAPEAGVKDLLGQAYFLRAYNHFWLVQLYGKIPYITDETPDLIANPLTPESREDVAAVYDKIQSDLLLAIENMSSARTGGQPNAWAAKAMLAKVYLTRATAPLKQTQYYADARDMADDVINNSPYRFTANLSEIFKLENVKNNDEFIFGFNTSLDFSGGKGCGPGPDEWGAWGGGQARPIWADRYPEQPRKYNYVLTRFPKNLEDSPEEWIWVDYSESTDKVPYQAKRTWPNQSIEVQLSEVDICPPLPILRFTDMLLTYAEAANMANGGPTQLAVDRLNMVINRANATFESPFPETAIPGTEALASMSMSKEEFDDKVIAERDYELCFEFSQYFDVLRKEKLEEINQPDISVNYAPYKYLFPIPPQDAISIGQNPGYE
ncbi:MAG: RagB/SusD family nutrient uptake outer membrane protein [Dysgonamonadaceae bacterium]|jgi:hypothetical protein|nr:RagB/SusD family nutrient uptake outer membrane protein [Dysgonamonadaceae bacterium]